MASNSSISSGIDSLNSIKTDLTNIAQQSNSPIIDLRSASDFSLEHWAGASHFYAENIIERLYELPKRNQALILYGSQSDIKKAQQKLTKKGYTIDAIFEWTPQLKLALSDLKLLEVGDSSPLLWSPAPILEKFHELYFDESKIGRALDIACGSGRDSVYLATKGWQVDSVDYLPDALNKVNLLAKNTRVNLNTFLADLENDQGKFLTNCHKYQLITVMRYLHRPLLPLIKQRIASGGYLVYQTFLRGCEKFGSPKRARFLLEEGELAQAFDGFKILLDEIHYLEDGRPTNVFIARCQ